MSVKNEREQREQLWTLFIKEVSERSKMGNLPLKNFLGSVAMHKECYDKAIRALTDEGAK